MTALKLPGAIAVLLSLNACASLPRAQCSGHELPAVADTLYFGGAGLHGQVTEVQWSQFLRSTITPRFPQGLTVLAASGQWLGGDGVPISEMTHVLQIVHPASNADEMRVTQIIAAYRLQFDQKSVLRVKVNACVSF